jgi:hypothetical protein
MMSEREAPWTLVMAKRYAEAADEYARCYAKGGDTFALRGHAKVLPLAGRPAEALEQFREVIESTEAKLRGGSDFIDLGTCHWQLPSGVATTSILIPPSGEERDQVPLRTFWSQHQGQVSMYCAGQPAQIRNGDEERGNRLSRDPAAVRLISTS